MVKGLYFRYIASNKCIIKMNLSCFFLLFDVATRNFKNYMRLTLYFLWTAQLYRPLYYSSRAEEVLSRVS